MLFGAQRPGGRRRGGAAGFGGGFGGFGGGPQGGGDAEATITLSVEEAVRGGSREIAISDPNTGSAQDADGQDPRGGAARGRRSASPARAAPGFGGGAAGDLLLKIEIAPDPRFRIEGSDILTTSPITPAVAVLGGEADVETPTGAVRVRIPAALLLRPQDPAARARAGAVRRRQGDKGDLLAEIRIVDPRER